MSYLKPAPSNLSNCKILMKTKCLNLGPKMPYLGIFRQKFKTNMIIFEISTLEFDFSGKFREKSKMPKFETKSALFGYFFLAGTWKQKCHIWNQYHRISLIAKFRKKAKISNFGTTNALFGYFLNWNLKTILSYLKSAPSNLSNCKSSWKNENA